MNSLWHLSLPHNITHTEDMSAATNSRLSTFTPFLIVAEMGQDFKCTLALPRYQLYLYHTSSPQKGSPAPVAHTMAARQWNMISAEMRKDFLFLFIPRFQRS